MNKELQDIIRYFDGRENSHGKTVLATVVDVKGSSYRLPGARMLIGENGEMLGTVSGGCLEADVLERAQTVLQTGAAEIFTYDTTQTDDSVFSLNMGCRGVVRILLEPASGANIFVKICRIGLEKQSRQFVATLISAENSRGAPVGGKILYNRTERFHFENLREAFKSANALTEECQDFFNRKEKAVVKTFQIENETFEFFFENINPPLNILIFGAGADAIPLAKTAKNLGWRVVVVDHRAAFATGDRFSVADKIVVSRPENLSEKLSIDENTAAVVMTHNYEHDKNILRFLLGSKAFYVGALGPKRRTANILREWRVEGVKISAAQLDKLYAPVGLDIGAETPEAIALSIAGEIQTVLAGRAGGFLRDRRTSIYDRDAA